MTTKIETNETHDAIALFDLDGTLADFDGEMRRQLVLLQSEVEQAAIRANRADANANANVRAHNEWYSDVHPWITQRRRLIKSKPGFWRGLPPLKPGFDVLQVARELGFENHVLTKGPNSNPAAWGEKIQWCQEHIPDLPVTIAQKKSLVYGKVLVDDWPDYFMPWLEVRPRGLVIAVAQLWNITVSHPRLVIYDGLNLDEVRERMTEARASVKRDR